MKKAYWIDDIRAQLEGFKSVTAMSDEMRDVIETESGAGSATGGCARWRSATGEL